MHYESNTQHTDNASQSGAHNLTYTHTSDNAGTPTCGLSHTATLTSTWLIRILHQHSIHKHTQTTRAHSLAYTHISSKDCTPSRGPSHTATLTGTWLIRISHQHSTHQHTDNTCTQPCLHAHFRQGLRTLPRTQPHSNPHGNRTRTITLKTKHTQYTNNTRQSTSNAL